MNLKLTQIETTKQNGAQGLGTVHISEPADNLS